MHTIMIKRGIVVSLGLAVTLSMAACGGTKPPTSAGPGNGSALPTTSAGPGNGTAPPAAGNRPGNGTTPPAASAGPIKCPTVPPAASAGPGNGHTVPPTASAGTAARDLASFFVAAQEDDARLRAAATVVNGGIVANGLCFTQATWDAVRAASPQPVAAAIPAGLNATLLQQTLLVYSELVSRYDAMIHTPIGPTPKSSDRYSTYQHFMDCLANGAVAASRFPADLAALEKLARAAPAVTIAAPDSRAAAELALRIADIGLANGGCASCGGQLATRLASITWGWHGPTSPDLWGWRDGSKAPPDGTIRGSIPFHVSYQPGKGWFADEYVC